MGTSQDLGPRADSYSRKFGPLAWWGLRAMKVAMAVFAVTWLVGFTTYVPLLVTVAIYILAPMVYGGIGSIQLARDYYAKPPKSDE